MKLIFVTVSKSGVAAGGVAMANYIGNVETLTAHAKCIGAWVGVIVAIVTTASISLDVIKKVRSLRRDRDERD